MKCVASVAPSPGIGGTAWLSSGPREEYEALGDTLCEREAVIVATYSASGGEVDFYLCAGHAEALGPARWRPIEKGNP